jgi:hypothetical protein
VSRAARVRSAPRRQSNGSSPTALADVPARHRADPASYELPIRAVAAWRLRPYASLMPGCKSQYEAAGSRWPPVGLLADVAGRLKLEGASYPVPVPLRRKGADRVVQCGTCGGADPSGDGYLRRIGPGLRAHHGYIGRREVTTDAQNRVPRSLGERVCEAVTEIQPGRVTSFAVSPPAAHRPGGQVCVNGHDVDLRVTEKSVDNILAGRPEPGLDDDAQLDADSSWHQPGESIFQVDRKLVASRFGEDDRYGRRSVNDKAPAPRLRQRGRPAAS